jgi:hypothetical protein
VQQRVAGADDAVEARLGEPDGLEIIALLGAGSTAISLSILAETTTATGALLGRRARAPCAEKALPLSAGASSTLQT